MITKHLPPEVIDFILSSVNSIEQLEILLFLRAEAQQAWSISEINAAIRSTEESIRERTELLHSQSLVTRAAGDPVRYRFAPATQTLGDVVEAVLEAYANRRAEVSEMIYNKPAGNIVGFANAFKFSRTKKDE